MIAIGLAACGDDKGGATGTGDDTGGATVDDTDDGAIDTLTGEDASGAETGGDEDVAGPGDDAEAPGDDAEAPVEDAGPGLEDADDEADVAPADDATPDVLLPPDGAAGDATEADVEPDAGPDPLDPATVPLRGSCAEDERTGRFTTEVSDLFSFVEGGVVDGINPYQVQSVVGEEGGCRLRKITFPFCDPLCEAGTTCDHDGTCVHFPVGQDAGTITVTGLSAVVTMDPKPPGNQYFNTSLPHPAFAPDSPIHLSSTDGYAGELDLYGVGHELLASEQTEWVIEEGVPVALSWDAAPEGARTEIYVSLNIDQHGLSPVTVLCEFDDDGAADIPASLVDALFAFGVSGFPNARLVRRTVDSQETAVGCVELLTRSLFVPDVTVSGHTPCTSPADCPPGETCNLPIQTCE